MKYWIRGKVVVWVNDHCYKYCYYHDISLYEPRVNPVEEENLGRGYLSKSCRKRIFR